jgi:transcription elongation factor Elf1
MGEPDINTLIVRRGQIKAIVTRFQNYLKSPDCDTKQIPPRQLKIEEARQNFELVQTAIEELENSIDITDHSQYKIDFENLFFEMVAEAEQKISSIRANQNETSFCNSNNGESINSTSLMIKLAALNIPVFNGNYNTTV